MDADQFDALMAYIDARIQQTVQQHLQQHHHTYNAGTIFHQKLYAEKCRERLAATFGLITEEAR